MYTRPMQPKDQRINFLVTRDERAMLDELSERSGLTISDWLRQAIRRGHEQESTRKVKPRRVSGNPADPRREQQAWEAAKGFRKR
jgi:hypothetical protein